DDGRAGSTDTDAADGGVLRGAENAWRARGDPAVQRRVPRDRIEAIELHSDAAVHDGVVQQIRTHVRRGDYDDDGTRLIAAKPVTRNCRARGCLLRVKCALPHNSGEFKNETVPVGPGLLVLSVIPGRCHPLVEAWARGLRVAHAGRRAEQGPRPSGAGV